MDGSSLDLLALRQAEDSAFAAGDHAGLARALAGQAALIQDPAEKAGLLYRAGAAAEAAGDLPGAVAHFAAVTAAPFWERLARFHRLEIHWRAGEWEPLLAVLGESIAAGGDGFDPESLRLERARLLAIRLGRMDEAQADLTAVLGQNPACREAIWLRLTLALRSGNWPDAAADYTALHQLAEADQDQALARSAALRLGQITEFHFKKPEDAAAWYARLPAGDEPLSTLPRFEIAEAGKRWPEAAKLLAELTAALEQAEGPEPGLRRSLARLLEDGAGDPAGAAREIDAVLAAEPENFSALYAAAERAQDGAEPARRAELDLRLAGQLTDPKEKAVFLADRTRVLVEDLNDPAGAMETARAWLALEPESVAAGRWLIEAGIRSGAIREAIAELDRELARTGDQREQQGLLFLKAELATHKLDDHALALAAYSAALKIPPSQFPILQSMGRLYALNRDWEPLSRIVAAPIKLVQDAPLKRYYQHRLGQLYLERLNLEDHAFAAYGELVKADAADRAALKAVARIARRKASWQNLVGALSRVADGAGDDQRLRSELRAESAWLLEIRLDQRDRALPLYKEAAEKGDAFARQALARLLYGGDAAAYGAAQAALIDLGGNQRLRAGRLIRLASVQEIKGELNEAWSCYEKARVTLSDVPDLFLPMLDLAQLAGFWPRYIALAEEFAGRVGDGMKPALLWEAAWARSETPGPNGQVDPAAMQQAFRALEEAAGGLRALRGGWLAATWAHDPRARADILARIIKSVADDLGLPLRLRLGRVLRDELHANEEGIAAFRQVLAKDPKSAPVIRELAQLYRQAGQWGELIRMILQELPLRKEVSLQVDIYLTLARLYEEKFQALDEAIKCQAAVLRLAPGRLESHADRVRLLEARERWEEVFAALTAWEAAAPQVNDKIAILWRGAEVSDTKLHDPNRAVAYLKKALDLDPVRTESLDRLARILEREGRWQEMVDILEAQTARVTAPADQATLQERIGAVCEEKLNQPGPAIDHLIRARDLDPRRVSILFRLERLFDLAARWRELIDTLERLAAIFAADAAKCIDYFARIGALWDEKENQLDPSIASWERVRGLDARHVPAHEALGSLYERTGRHAEFVDRSAALAELVIADLGRAVSLLVRAGQVTETELKDDDRALKLYYRGMEVDGRSVAPVAAAGALFTRRSQWPEAASMVLREESITAEPGRKLELFAAAGDIYEHKLTDLDQAARAYEQALQISRDYLPAVIPLSEIYFGRSAFAPARPLYEIRVKKFRDETPPQRAEIWFKAGWCAEQAADVAPAMERYHASVDSQADYRPSLERLSELYFKQEKWEQAALFTERLLAVVRVADDAEATFMLLGRQGLTEVKLNRIDRAVAAFESALALKPGHYDTLFNLVELYKRQAEWKKALVAYDQLIHSAPNKKAAADGLYGKGEILEDQIKEENSAVAHYTKAVQVAPDHLPAWTRLARIYLNRKAWPEAEVALTNLLRLDHDTPHQVQHHYDLGSVYRDGMKDLGRARGEFEAALKLNELHIPAMQALGDIYLEQQEWEKFITTSEKFVRILPADQQASLLPTFFKMGEVYRDHLKNTERAIISYQQVIKQEPDNERARGELASLYVSDPKFIDQAKTENLNLIRLKPFRPQSYRDLANIYKSQKNLDAQYWLFGMLKRFGNLDLEEEMFFEANQKKAVKSSKRTLKELDREGMLIHPDEKGPLRDLLTASGDFLEKVFPPALEKLGVKKSARVNEKAPTPTMNLAIEILTNLGYEGAFELYSPPGAEPAVINSPPSIVISPEYLARFNVAEQRFIMGRLLEHFIDRHAVAFMYPPEQVIYHMALLAMGADDKVRLNVPYSEAELDKRLKAMKKIISRKNKGEIEHAAERLTQEMVDTDPAAWRRALEHTGNRAGLLVCGDMFAAISAIMKTDPRFKNLKVDEMANPEEVWQKNEYVVEMLAYSVSDPFFRLRERTGFSITSA